MIGEPATLDPYSSTASDLTYELLRPVYPTLFRIEPDGTAVPDLARTATSGASGGLEVKLNKRRWSDGRPITARDVAQSYARIDGSFGLFGAAAGGRSVDPGVKVRGRYRLTIEGLRTEQSLASPLFVLPHGRFDPKVSGGPFRIAETVPGFGITYKRNKSWEGTVSSLNSVRVEYIEDLDTMVALLQQSRLDAATPPSAVNLVDRLDAAQLEQSSALGWEEIALDFDEASIGEPERTAVAGAVDRTQLQEGLIRDDGRISNTLSPAPGGRGASGPWKPSTTSAAVPDVQLAVGKGDELTEQIQEVLQLQLDKVGSTAELVSADTRTFYGEWRASSPTDVSIVRVMGFPGAETKLDKAIARTVTGMPLFEVSSFVTWRGDVVQGLAVNPTIEGPLWNMQDWSKV
ncbi:MAG: peptide/nickel transport system substrate-binding protein [Actinomycetota bacterium]|nr:peptide/nickel transport system substrate-binding protein [Actinomycetota bacterium]